MNTAASILLMEDNVGDVTLIREAFAQRCYDVGLQVIADGGEALRFLETLVAPEPDGSTGQRGSRAAPDLILTDLNLPRVHGCVLLKFIKSSVHLRSIPHLAFTSSDDHFHLTGCAHLVRSTTSSNRRPGMAASAWPTWR